MSAPIPPALKEELDRTRIPLPEPRHLLQGLIARVGLAPLLDMLGDEFPQYANDLHEIVERVESDAAALIGRKS